MVEIGCVDLNAVKVVSQHHCDEWPLRVESGLGHDKQKRAGAAGMLIKVIQRPHPPAKHGALVAEPLKAAERSNGAHRSHHHTDAILRVDAWLYPFVLRY